MDTVKLISEQFSDEIEYICEEKENGKKEYKIKGIFMQADIKNRNGRVYPMEILQKEVKRYNKEYINENRAFGELGHPEGPQINLERVSHMIKSLKVEGKNFIGRAKVMSETPYGKIVKNLIDEGAKLGVSSRGMGSIKQNTKNEAIVGGDFHLATAADIVADPSAPDAFVQGVMEGREWIYESGVFKQIDLEQYKEDVDNSNRKNREETKIKGFVDLFNKLSR